MSESKQLTNRAKWEDKLKAVDPAVARVRLARINNLRRLADAPDPEFKQRRDGAIKKIGWAGLARRLGVTYIYLHAIAGRKPTRWIGEIAARNIESKLGLPSGWLDITR